MNSQFLALPVEGEDVYVGFLPGWDCKFLHDYRVQTKEDLQHHHHNIINLQTPVFPVSPKDTFP